MTDERRPRSLYRLGADPDPRFSLANERTFLAWIRTALAVAAGGIALLVAFDVPDELSSILPATAFLISLVLVAAASIRWLRTERALRLGIGLPTPWMAVSIVVVLSLALTAGFVWTLIAP